MKKQRRVEITAFRRRTTTVVHDKSAAGSPARPDDNGEETPPAQTQITSPDDAGRSALGHGRGTGARQSNRKENDDENSTLDERH